MAKTVCPFDKKTCKKTCELYRRGIRYWDDPKHKPEPFERCGLSIGIDCLENIITRSIGQQKATEQARNEMSAVKEILYAAAARKVIEDRVEEKKVLESRRPIDSVEVETNA